MESTSKTTIMMESTQCDRPTVYREIFELLNFFEFREFWQNVKFSFAKFYNVRVARRARGNSQTFFSQNLCELSFRKNLATRKFPDIRYNTVCTSDLVILYPTRTWCIYTHQNTHSIYPVIIWLNLFLMEQ